MADDENTQDQTKNSRSNKPGCLLYLILLGAAALAYGVHLMGRWDSMGGSAKSGAIILLVIGTLLLLPPLLIFIFSLALKIFFGRLTKQFSGLAEHMVDANKALYDQIHEFRPATDDDFEDLNRAYYDDTARTLADAGFRHLGDLVDATIEETNDLTTPIRILASPDGTTQVALYHFQIPNLPEKFAGQQMLICDLTTEFSDGTFLMTSNTQESDLTTSPQRIIKTRLPLTTPIPDLLVSHESRKQKRLAADPALTPVSISTLEDAIASEKRQQQAKNDFRKQIGFVDPEEVRRIADDIPNQDPAVTNLTIQAVEKARKTHQPDGKTPP